MDRQSGVEAQLTHLRVVPGVYSAYMWKNVSLTFWFDAPSLQDCAVFEEGCRQRVAAHPEGLSSILVMVPGGRNMPNAETRAEVTRILREHGTRAAAVAVLIPGIGFWASALRSLMVALSMVRPHSMPLSIFNTPAELADWLAPLHGEHTGVQLEAAELLGVFQAAERAMSADRAA